MAQQQDVSCSFISYLVSHQGGTVSSRDGAQQGEFEQMDVMPYLKITDKAEWTKSFKESTKSYVFI